MKKRILSSLIAGGAMLASAAVWAAPTENAFVAGPQQWSDDSGEVLIKGAGNMGAGIEVGDALVGVLGVTSFPTSGVAANSVNEYTAVFATAVTAITPIAPAAIPAVCGAAAVTTCSAFTFGPVADFNAALAAVNVAVGSSIPAFTDLSGGALSADTIAIFLEDSANNFDRDTSIAGAFDTGSDGTARLIAGLVGANGDSWGGTGPTDLTEFGAVASGQGVGGFTIDATILEENFASFDFNQSITANGSIKPSAASAFVITDDTTFEVTATPVPEPMSLALMGIGMLAGGAFTRSRKNRKA